MKPRRVFKSLLLCGVMLAVIALVTWQYRALADAQNQNRALASQIESLRAPPEPTPTPRAPDIDLNELARLRAEHLELLRLRAEITRLREESRGRTETATTAPTLDAAEIEKIRSPFMAITTNDIPGRYRCLDNDPNSPMQQQYIVLHPNGTFTTYSRADGQPTRSSSYKWMLYPQGLILNWMSGMSFFQNVSSRGVYVSNRPNRTQLRIEKLEDQ